MKIDFQPQIFVSSACSPERNVVTAVHNLSLEGFDHIELTGGNDYSPNYSNDLMRLKNKFGLTFAVHNYFPAPKKHFALNIADPSDTVGKDIELHFERVAEAVEIFKLGFFSIHAGLMIAPNFREFGSQLSSMNFFELGECEKSIALRLDQLRRYLKFSPSHIYIENNVFSEANREKFPNSNPFLFCFFEDFIETFQKHGVRPLLDLAHLKVSCKTMGRNFLDEAQKFVGHTDYVHISDNDGTSDANLGVELESEIFDALMMFRGTLTKVSIEVYSGIDQVKMTYANLLMLLDDQNDIHPKP